mgnify:FL=1
MKIILCLVCIEINVIKANEMKNKKNSIKVFLSEFFNQ